MVVVVVTTATATVAAAAAEAACTCGGGSWCNECRVFVVVNEVARKWYDVGAFDISLMV